MNATAQQTNGETTNINRMIVAYPVDLPCKVENGTWKEDGILISINAQYARIACNSYDGLDKIPYDSTLVLKTELKAGSCCLHSVECVVAWKHDRELGLEFKTGAKVGLLELQDEFNGMAATARPEKGKMAFLEKSKVTLPEPGPGAKPYAPLRDKGRDERRPRA